ncbi:NADPH-dependent FMN reductase [Streptomyces sp. NPDC001985]|uniref:NADPH-dependent FMN reductase n=1 Tax=Streptomyces sp. NPDC001985 TaxID=3154406 RepID=UPI00332E2D2C
MKFLALCGSLRAGSFNGAVIRAAAELCPPTARLDIGPDLGQLPFFNQDVERRELPPEVRELRERCAAADGLLIASPEYARGTSGVLKNALEWLVGGGQQVGKPVVLVTASTSMQGGDRAQAWLAETLTMMQTTVLPENLRIGLAAAKITDGRLVDPATREELRACLSALSRAAGAARESAVG